jgi:osmotically-inducible protein OsmY
VSHDSQLEQDVRVALAADPRLADNAIAVSGGAGAVTLRGTVSTVKQRRAAVEAARRVHGVDEVYDVLKIRLVPGDPRDDKLRGTALQLLISDSRVPDDNVDVDVAAAWVTLRGHVRHQEESDAAFEDVTGLEGVGGITKRDQGGHGALVDAAWAR